MDTKEQMRVVQNDFVQIVKQYNNKEQPYSFVTARVIMNIVENVVG